MDFEACSAFTHVTACTLAESLSRLSSIEGFSGFVTSATAPIATGWNEPVPGRDFHPLWTKRLSRRTRTISLVGNLEGGKGFLRPLPSALGQDGFVFGRHPAPGAPRSLCSALLLPQSMGLIA